MLFKAATHFRYACILFNSASSSTPAWILVPASLNLPSSLNKQTGENNNKRGGGNSVKTGAALALNSIQKKKNALHWFASHKKSQHTKDRPLNEWRTYPREVLKPL